jgi:hypothetical protein
MTPRKIQEEQQLQHEALCVVLSKIDQDKRRTTPTNSRKILDEVLEENHLTYISASGTVVAYDAMTLREFLQNRRHHMKSNTDAGRGTMKALWSDGSDAVKKSFLVEIGYLKVDPTAPQNASGLDDGEEEEATLDADDEVGDQEDDFESHEWTPPTAPQSKESLSKTSSVPASPKLKSQLAVSQLDSMTSTKSQDNSLRNQTFRIILDKIEETKAHAGPLSITELVNTILANENDLLRIAPNSDNTLPHDFHSLYKMVKNLVIRIDPEKLGKEKNTIAVICARGRDILKDDFLQKIGANSTVIPAPEATMTAVASLPMTTSRKASGIGATFIAQDIVSEDSEANATASRSRNLDLLKLPGSSSTSSTSSILRASSSSSLAAAQTLTEEKAKPRNQALRIIFRELDEGLTRAEPIKPGSFFEGVLEKVDAKQMIAKGLLIHDWKSLYNRLCSCIAYMDEVKLGAKTRAMSAFWTRGTSVLTDEFLRQVGYARNVGATQILDSAEIEETPQQSPVSISAAKSQHLTTADFTPKHGPSLKKTPAAVTSLRKRAPLVATNESEDDRSGPQRGLVIELSTTTTLPHPRAGPAHNAVSEEEPSVVDKPATYNINKRRKLNEAAPPKTNESLPSPYDWKQKYNIPSQQRGRKEQETVEFANPAEVSKLHPTLSYTLTEAASHIDTLKERLSASFFDRAGITSSVGFFRPSPGPALAKLYREAQSHDASDLLYLQATGELTHPIMLRSLIDTLLNDIVTTTKLDTGLLPAGDSYNKTRLQTFEAIGVDIPELLIAEKSAYITSDLFIKEKVKPAAVVKAWEAWVVLLPHLVFVLGIAIGADGKPRWKIAQEGFEAGLREIVEEVLLLEAREGVANTAEEDV